MKTTMLRKTKLKASIMSLMLLLPLCVLAQVEEEQINLTQEQMEQLIANEEVYSEWLTAMETPGVKIDGKNMVFSDEARRLIADSNYRNSVYKTNGYSFLDVRDSFANSEIQKAFWQMITIYPENKDAIVKYIYAFDSVLPADKVLVGAFYTYAFFDPAITKIENGKPDIYRPDLFEDYLRRTRELVSYVMLLRKEAKKTKEG